MFFGAGVLAGRALKGLVLLVVLDFQLLLVVLDFQVVQVPLDFQVLQAGLLDPIGPAGPGGPGIPGCGSPVGMGLSTPASACSWAEGSCIT